MSYPAISLATATVGRHRCPQKRLQTARQPPVYPNSSPDHRACNSLTPSAVLTPSIPVLRWIRAKVLVAIVDELAPLLIGKNPLEVEALWELLYGVMMNRGHRGGFFIEALSGIDVALWDLWGKATGQPA